MRRLSLVLVAFAVIAAGPPKNPPPPPVPPVPPVVPEAPVVPPDPLGPMPELGPATAFVPPAPSTLDLPNGASLWVIEDHQLPLVTLTVSVPGGAGTDPAGKGGLASISDQMMTKGAGTRNAVAFAQAIDEAGIQLSVDTDDWGSTITMSLRASVLPTALDLLSDMVLRPRYGGKDFKTEQKLEVGQLAQDLNEPVTVARQAAWKRWFGASHPYGRPSEGTPGELKTVKVADAKAYHQKSWVPAGAAWTVAGDVHPADVTAAINQRFSTWTGGPAATVPLPQTPTHANEKILLVDRPGSAQTMFYVIYPGKKLGDTTVTPLRAGTIVLGGTFTSRLNHLLREVKGYTYGVRASTVQLPEVGVQTVTTRIRTDATGPAMTDLIGELRRIGDGVTEAEVGKARGAWLQDMVESMDGLEGMVDTFALAHRAKLGPQAIPTELAAMAAVDKPSIDAAMKGYDPANAVFVLVGDLKQIQPPLTAAGFSDVEIGK
jgi:zinc protease